MSRHGTFTKNFIKFVPRFQNFIGKSGRISINSKTFPLEIKPTPEYQQKVQFVRTHEVNVSGEFQIVITNACPSNLKAKRTGTFEDVLIPSVSWTGYSE